MKKSTSKIISLILVLILSVGMSVPAFAAEAPILPFGTSEQRENQIALRSMPYDKVVTDKFRIARLTGTVGLRVDAYITANAQNGDVISVNKVDVYPDGYALSFVSWETTNVKSTINQPKRGHITLEVTGRVVFQFPDLGTGLLTNYYYTETRTLEIDCKV